MPHIDSGKLVRVFHLPANTIMSDPEFKNDAAYAAGAYRKPGRR
jgi:hypothetical protein